MNSRGPRRFAAFMMTRGLSTSRRPHMVRQVVLATFTDPRTGEQHQALYERTTDRSRYTPDRLRDLRGDGRHR